MINPISAKQKFGLAVQDAFDPYAYFIAGAFAGLGQAQNDPKSWGQGWGAFGKRYAASFADQTDEDMMTSRHPGAQQDPRYFRMVEGSAFSWTAVSASG